jgi:hypothetical protein
MEVIVGAPISKGPSDGALVSSQVTPTVGLFSNGVWNSCPAGVLTRPEKSLAFLETFVGFPKYTTNTTGNLGQWQAFTSDGGAIADLATVGGGVSMYSDGDNEGAVLMGYTTPFKIYNGGPRLWFEVCLKTSTIATTKHDFLAGLIDAETPTAIMPIAADGTLADANFVGFQRLEATNYAYARTCYKANGVAVVAVDATGCPLVADTYTNLGMYFDGRVLRFYHDGNLLANTVTNAHIGATDGTDFPNDITLTPVIAMLNATASSPGTLSVLGLRCVQMRDIGA